MWRHHLLISIIVYILVLLQTSFFYTDDWLGKINFILLLLISLLFIYSFNYALVWAIISGYLLDLYSNMGFGFNIVGLIITIVLINYLLKNVIYFRYRWAFILLVFIAVIFFNLFITFVSYLFFKLNFEYYYFSFNFINILFQLIIDFFVIFVILYFQKFFKHYLLIYDRKK